MIEFKLPSMGSDMDEGKLLEWKVKPGDTVKKGDIVAIVDTTKAAVDVESWVDGIVHEELVHTGETVPVGTVLATFLAPGETPPPKEAKPAPATPTPAAPARKAVSPAARARARELGVDVDAIKGS
ncbi:MAG: biotin/lipoyl-containing protein, partial [Bacillota bacterium]